MPESVEDYFAGLPEGRQQPLLELHDIILQQFPDCVVDMAYRMPTYHRGKAWVAIANQKHYLSLYTCSAEHLVHFKQRQPAVRTGKGCINFKPGTVLPQDDIAEVVRRALTMSKS